jgi:hypothetical protein
MSLSEANTQAEMEAFIQQLQGQTLIVGKLPVLFELAIGNYGLPFLGNMKELK